jgi:hypothetical protein
MEDGKIVGQVVPTGDDPDPTAHVVLADLKLAGPVAVWSFRRLPPP